MTVHVMDASQVKPLQEHLRLALNLEPAEIDSIRALASQLKGRAVLPILGAGASHDCGMRLAGDIAVDLHADCCADEGLKSRIATIEPSDLGGIAEAIYDYHGDSHQAVLEAIGMPDPKSWPGTPDVDRHLCALRMIARSIREHKGFRQAFSFNYDCCKEAALRSEGFSLGHETTAGLVWPDHANIFCNKEMYTDTAAPGDMGFELVKAHGCAEHYRQAYDQHQSEDVAEAIVIRTEQIATWKKRLWAQRGLADRVQRDILLLIGFSGQDPATATELKEVLEDVCEDAPNTTPPRLVVIDHNPDTDALQELISVGVGPDGTDKGTVTKISTANSSTTAVLMALLAEIIALELESALSEVGLTLASDLDTRLGLLTLAGPVMARWSFLLSGASAAYIQRVNAGIETQDYVPLAHAPKTSARALKIRKELREQVGLDERESIDELIGTDGFVVTGGRAFLPLGNDLNEVKAAHLTGALERAKDILPWPNDAEAILVCEQSGTRRGVSLATGLEVPVP